MFEWRGYNSALDEQGQPLVVHQISQKVDNCSASGCTLTENIGVDITRDYLLTHQNSGIRIQVSGRGGKEVFFVPPSYIQVFVAKVEGQSATSTASTYIPPPAPTITTATEAQIDAEYEAARKQDTVKAYQEFLYRYRAKDKHYAEAAARLDQLLHPGGAMQTEWPPRSNPTHTTQTMPVSTPSPAPVTTPVSAQTNSQVKIYNEASTADTQLRNAEREFRAGRMSLEEFREIKRVLQGQ